MGRKWERIDASNKVLAIYDFFNFTYKDKLTMQNAWEDKHADNACTC